MDPTTLDLVKEWGALGLFVAWATWLIRFQRAEREERDVEWRRWMDSQRESFLEALAGLATSLHEHNTETRTYADRILNAIRRGGGEHQ